MVPVLAGDKWGMPSRARARNRSAVSGRIEVDDAPVLVIGGAGYIGGMLCRELLRRGRSVTVLDSLLYGDFAIRELLVNPRFKLYIRDCRDVRAIAESLDGVRSVVHLAAIVGDPACEQDRESAKEINYRATRMLIDVAQRHGVERFVFASSCSVYGASDSLLNETSTVKPMSLYAETKVNAETRLLQSATENFHPTILRFATVFGHSARPRFDLVVNLLTAQAYKEGVVKIFNGHQWRPFIHVSDVAIGILCALDSPKGRVSGEIFNLGDSRLNHTLTDIADKVRAVFPNTRIEHTENSDQRNYRVSFEKIKHQLGFECLHTVEEGIEQMKRAFEDHSVIDHTDIRHHNEKYLNQNKCLLRKHGRAMNLMNYISNNLKQGRPTLTGGLVVKNERNHVGI